MKYYYREHLSGYDRIKSQGKTAWWEIHGGNGFDDFASRAFLQTVLPRLKFAAPRPTALELGCGTGPAACFLAKRGFEVEGIDLVPTAIEIAREQALQRNLNIRFATMDVVDLPHDGQAYDLIVDSFCLQGIVTDIDRQRLFAAVRARLKPLGYYLVSSAHFDPQRLGLDQTVVKDLTGKVYHQYGPDLIDLDTNIVYAKVDDHESWEDSIQIAGRWLLMTRRHHRPPQLRAELGAAGFDVLYQDRGNLICIHADADIPLS